MRIAERTRGSELSARIDRIGFFAFAIGLLSIAASAAALDSKAIFDEYSHSIVQLQIVEIGSGAKRSIGSGFVVGRSGELATNYHVISDLVIDPDLYRAERVDEEGIAHPVELLGFDVVRDIAIVRSATVFGQPFVLHRDDPKQGERIYAIGDPYDLGLTIVEGLYNGRLEHARYDRIHFTGSLNPGMSGGPALLPSGEVVGVNVATSGNQVSFLVPAPDLQRLIAKVGTADPMPAATRMSELRDQLFAHQRDYYGEILATEGEPVEMGPYVAPSKIAPFFNCWGDVQDDDDDALHRVLSHQCTTEDSVYISDRHHMSVVWLQHRQLETEELSSLRFYWLYSWFFESNWSQLGGNEEILTEFRCRTRFVDSGGLVFKTAFCARRYIDLPGLYDVVFKAAHLGEDQRGFETALVATAISLENARALADRYLAGIRWKE